LFLRATNVRKTRNTQTWRRHMNTGRETNRSDIALLNEAIVLADEALGHVVGGCSTNELNPLPLPPRDPNPGEDKASPKFSWGVS
jgi:hypothetical protein